MLSEGMYEWKIPFEYVDFQSAVSAHCPLEHIAEPIFGVSATQEYARVESPIQY